MSEEWPKVRSRETITMSPWVDIIVREIEFSPGEPTQIYHAVDQSDYLAIVARTPDGRFPIVRQFRPALESFTWELPAGLCDVALVVGADTTPKGFLAPNAGERGDDPDWLRFRLLGATNPTYFALYARRRMEMFGATPDDFAKVKVKNARHGLQNPYARYRKEVTLEDINAAPVVADPLRLLEIARPPMVPPVVIEHGVRVAGRASR
jgi:hypothetical protein